MIAYKNSDLVMDEDLGYVWEIIIILEKKAWMIIFCFPL